MDSLNTRVRILDSISWGNVRLSNIINSVSGHYTILASDSNHTFQKLESPVTRFRLSLLKTPSLKPILNHISFRINDWYSWICLDPLYCHSHTYYYVSFMQNLIFGESNEIQISRVSKFPLTTASGTLAISAGSKTWSYVCFQIYENVKILKSLGHLISAFSVIAPLGPCSAMIYKFIFGSKSPPALFYLVTCCMHLFFKLQYLSIFSPTIFHSSSWFTGTWRCRTRISRASTPSDKACPRNWEGRNPRLT